MTVNARVTPFSKIFPGTFAFLKLERMDNTTYIMGLSGSNVYQYPVTGINPTSMTTVGNCRYFTDATLNTDIRLHTTSFSWAQGPSRYSKAANHFRDGVRTYLIYYAPPDNYKVYTVDCSGTDAITRTFWGNIPQNGTQLSSPLSYITSTQLLLTNSSTVVIINNNDNKTITYPNRRFVGVTSDAVTGAEASLYVYLYVPTSTMHVSILRISGDEATTTSFRDNATSLDFYSVVTNDLAIIGPKLATGIPELFLFNRTIFERRIYAGDAGYDTISYSNNRLVMYGPTTKKGIFHDWNSNITIRSNYTGNAALTTFSSPSVTGYAAMISPQQKEGDRKMAVYSVCTNNSDCQGGDIMTISSCVNNVCQYTVCPADNPFLCPAGSSFVCAASILACLMS